jgi:hypothetical protein
VILPGEFFEPENATRGDEVGDLIRQRNDAAKHF